MARSQLKADSFPCPRITRPTATCKLAQAVRLGLAVGAVAALPVPVTAVTCPVTSPQTLSSPQTLISPCNVNNGGAINISNTGSLTATSTLTVDSGGAINIQTGTPTGGSLNNTGSLTNAGTLSNAAGATLSNVDAGSSLANQSGGKLYNSGYFANTHLTNAGILQNRSGGRLDNYGLLTNQNGGAFTNQGKLYNSYTTSNLTNQAGASLTNSFIIQNYGGGAINNAGTLANEGAIFNGKSTDTNASFNNQLGGTLNNSTGSAGIKNYGALTNAGTINTINTSVPPSTPGTSGIDNKGSFINQAGGVWNNSRFSNNYSGASLSNAGTINIQSGGKLDNQAGATFSNTGTINVASSGQITGGGTLTQTAGSLTVNGTGTVTQGLVELKGGDLNGNLTTGSVGGVLNVSNGASVSPGNGSGSIGALNVSGSLNLLSGSILNIELGGLSNYDKLNVTGTATLPTSGATLNLFAINGFSPSIGNSFDILFYATFGGGTFSSVNLSGFAPTLTVQLNTLSDRLRVNVTAVPLPASGWLFLSAAGMMAGFARRRHKTPTPPQDT